MQAFGEDALGRHGGGPAKHLLSTRNGHGVTLDPGCEAHAAVFSERPVRVWGRSGGGEGGIEPPSERSPESWPLAVKRIARRIFGALPVNSTEAIRSGN
jgi:hypothetical protein